MLKDLKDACKYISTKVEHAMDPIVDWIKYGDGKYVWNIAKTTLSAFVTVVGAIVSVCAIPFTGGAAIPIAIGLIGAAANIAGTFITLNNSYVSIRENAKAISKSGNLFDEYDGDPSAARYYGSITKVSEYYNKTDMEKSLRNSLYKSNT